MGLITIEGLEKYSAAITQSHSLYQLVDFWGPSCAPCLTLNHTLEQIIGNFPDITFFKVNADTETAIASYACVRGLPTLILYSKGNEIDRWLGALSAAKLSENLKAAISRS